MLKIDNKLDTRSIEKAYDIIYAKNTIDLLITKKLSDEIGIIPALIQLIATWYNEVPDGKIIIDVKNSDDLGEFYSLDFFFPVITYCWPRMIKDNHGVDLKPFLKDLNILAHDKMRKQESGGGPKTLLSCFDHLSVKKGLLNAFYIDGEFIDNEITFGAAIDKSLKQVVSFNKTLSKSNLSSIYLDLIDIIYELVKNTDNWATTDGFGKPINPNTRGLYLKFHKKNNNTFLAEFNDQEGIRGYFSKANFQKNTQNEIYFLELSVFDTGVGFVNRYKSIPESVTYSAKEQVNIVKECMLVNNTSAVGISKTSKGKGLDKIMNILDGKGFFWLRTSNVSLYRNMLENRYIKGCKTEEIDLFDWHKSSSSDFSSLKYSKGSVMTIVYPISNFSNE